MTKSFPRVMVSFHDFLFSPVFLDDDLADLFQVKMVVVRDSNFYVLERFEFDNNSWNFNTFYGTQYVTSVTIEDSGVMYVDLDC